MPHLHHGQEGRNVNTHPVQRRRRVDQLEDRVLELEAKLAAIESFTGADGASLADELTTIYELLPRFREEMREELERRAKKLGADQTS
jgi:hypothetical protein